MSKDFWLQINNPGLTDLLPDNFEVHVKDKSIKPFGLKEYYRHIDNYESELTLEFECIGQSVVELRSVNIQPIRKFSQVALIEDGWMFPMLSQASKVLPDRNFINKLILEEEKDLHVDVKFLEHNPMEIDPAFMLIEGRKRRFPTKDEMWLELNELIDKIQATLKKLPTRKYMINRELVNLDAIFKMSENKRNGQELNFQFLSRVLPILRQRNYKKEKAQHVVNKINNVANSLGVGNSVPHLLAVDCANDWYYQKLIPKVNIGPGRGLLKPHASSDEDIYNVISDLYQIEFLGILMGRESEGVRVAGLTEDKGLVASWCLLAPNRGGLASTENYYVVSIPDYNS